jgi:CheY-like chemotaxis protein
MFGRTKKEITIHREYQTGIWTVEVDAAQIEQVLLNLYVNAGQAMAGAGELYLRTKNVGINKNDVKPYDIEPGKFVEISVTDTGTGMDKDMQQKIFDPFFTTKEVSKGAGLGLASAYGIIKNHGGFINVNSEIGKGSTFYIYLPASGKKLIKEEKLPLETIKGKETVLLVDDQELIIDVGQQLLKKLGYKVLTARGGQEATEVYKKNKDRIGLVLLDMVMPGMGGEETYEVLKKIDPDIKVLVSSGYSLEGKAQLLLERGCNGFIQKPFKMDKLSQKIRGILDNKI